MSGTEFDISIRGSFFLNLTQIVCVVITHESAWVFDKPQKLAKI